MKVTVTAKREFPQATGDGQSRRIVSVGEELEVNLTEARRLLEQDKIQSFDEPERKTATRAADKKDDE